MSIPLPPPPPHATLLVADIGGTHARLAWADTQGQLALQVWARVADHSGIDALLETVVSGISQASAIVLAVAGRVDAQGRAHCANLPWQIDTLRLQARWHCPVRVINDFHALALACTALHAGSGQVLVAGSAAPGSMQGDGPPADGPLLVIGPGTGLGAAIVLPSRDGPAQILPSEAGQMALAAHDARQAAVIAQLQLQRADAHVPVEAAVSGPGLLQLYRALCALDGVPGVLHTPETVSQAAIAGDDARAVQALELFCHWLGSFCGDLALASGAQRIWLAGGIIPHMAGFLAHSRFAASLQAKGVMSALMTAVDVRWIEHGALGLRGAALAAPAH